MRSSVLENGQKYWEDVENTLQLAAPRVMDVLLYIERVRIEWQIDWQQQSAAKGSEKDGMERELTFGSIKIQSGQ